MIFVLYFTDIEQCDFNMDKILRKMALEYHRQPKPGKIEVVPTKPYNSPGDLSLAYSPGEL